MNDHTCFKMIQENLSIAKTAICRIQMLLRQDCEELRALSQAHSTFENVISNLEFEARNRESDKARWDREFKADVKKLIDYSFTEEMESYCEMKGIDKSESVNVIVMKAFHDLSRDHIFCTIAGLYTDMERTKN